MNRLGIYFGALAFFAYCLGSPALGQGAADAVDGPPPAPEPIPDIDDAPPPEIPSQLPEPPPPRSPAVRATPVAPTPAPPPPRPGPQAVPTPVSSQPTATQPQTAPAKTSNSVPEGLQVFYNDWIQTKLEIGLRSTSYDLDTTMMGDAQTFEGTYFGSINEMRPIQDRSPSKWFIQYAPIPWVGIGYTVDTMELENRDGPEDFNTDGNVNIDSSYIYLFARYPIVLGEVDVGIPITLTLVPYLELGQADHKTSFAPEASWAARGNSLVLQDNDSSYYSFGIDLFFNKNFAINFMYRRTEYSINGEYRVADGRAPVPVEIPMDSDTFGIGVKYIF